MVDFMKHIEINPKILLGKPDKVKGLESSLDKKILCSLAPRNDK